MKTMLLSIVGLGLLLSSSVAEEAAPQNPVLQPIFQQLQTLIRRYYPNASGHLLGDKIHFEQDTRIFIIHEPLKTGVWQDPWEERGPNKGGIVCKIELQRGPYLGAAIMPQFFDKRYFTVFLIAPYSQKLDSHLHVQLLYPRGVSEEFIKAFTDTINSFSQ